MSFVRPEAAQTLARWRDFLIATILAGVGSWWIFVSGGLLFWFGFPLIIGAALFCVSGYQRMRFRQGRKGPGIVRIDEGAIAYFGPLSGGIIAQSELRRVVLDGASSPKHWVLSQPGQEEVYIPITAQGADALFDVFSSLPGIQTERMLSLIKDENKKREIVWQKPDSPLPHKKIALN